MAHGVPLLCAWIGFILRCAETERVGKGRVAGSNREGALSSKCNGRQATWVVRGRRGTSPRVCMWQEPSSATTFLFSFASLYSFLPAFLLVEQSSLFSPSPSFFFFLFIPRWHSPILQAGSNRLLFVSRWQPTVLCSLTPPSNKAPSHDTDTPTNLSSKWVNLSGTNTLAT